VILRATSICLVRMKTAALLRPPGNPRNRAGAGADAGCVLPRAREMVTHEQTRVISDNGPQLIDKDFTAPEAAGAQPSDRRLRDSFAIIAGSAYPSAIGVMAT